MKTANHQPILISFFMAMMAMLLPVASWAGEHANTVQHTIMNLTHSPIGYIAIGLFVLAYVLVMLEEQLHLRKSKPVIVAAGLIWMVLGWFYAQQGDTSTVEHALRHNLLEYAELLLFLLVAMTFINAMEEMRLFDSLRSYLVIKGFSLRALFWITGILAFFISPIADNLTTALLMCAVAMKVGEGNKSFINLACINIVIAANAGGAFSPFGDITTLMVWREGHIQFQEFISGLFVPSVVNFALPAFIMQFFVPNETPKITSNEVIKSKRGGKRVVALFLFTIALAVISHSFFHLPPVLGMMTGLGIMQLFGFYLRRTFDKSKAREEAYVEYLNKKEIEHDIEEDSPFDVFHGTAKAEWDTLLFFYGVVMCVGGLGFIGYLSMASEVIYGQWNHTWANISVGVLSAIVDNIPVMFAVLKMEPDMLLDQWLLVTLTAGVGGSLLSIGSAAGVALMGQARGYYTFFGHLKWTPVIALGYAGSILVHILMNAPAT